MIKGLNHLTLSVSDLDKSFSFYRDTIGLTPKFKSKTTAYFEDGSLWLALSLDENTRNEPIPEYTHVAFDVSTDSFEQLSKAIKDSGAKIFKDNKSEGNSLYFLDPDGHKLEIHIGDINSRLSYYRTNGSEDYEFFDSSFIRPAKLEEAEFLSELALRSKAIWGYFPEFIEACRPHIYVNADYINSWPVRVLESDGKILGFYSLKTINDEHRLDNLWIEPDYWSAGT